VNAFNIQATVSTLEKVCAMKSHPSASSNGHLDEWRFFSLVIVCLTSPILLTVMMSRDPPFAAQDDCCASRIQHRISLNLRETERSKKSKNYRDPLFSTWNAFSPQRGPLASSYPLTENNSQSLPGVLSFSQARDLEQGMASNNPSNAKVPRAKEFNLFRM
jgi:hypothetical protein